MSREADHRTRELFTRYLENQDREKALMLEEQAVQARLAMVRADGDRIRNSLESCVSTSRKEVIRVICPEAPGGMFLVATEFDAHHGLFIERLDFRDADDLPAPAAMADGPGAWDFLGDADPSMPIRGRDPEADSGNVLPLPAAS